MARCTNCGANAVVTKTGDYQYVESGLENVILRGIELLECQECGNVDPVIPRMQKLHQSLAQAIVSKDHRLSGKEIRFLRKYLGMTADKFAEILGTDKTRISKWENDADRPSDQMDRLVRTVAMHLGEGLGKNSEQVVRSFPEIADDVGSGQYQGSSGKVTYAAA
jgi:putative zinc finger/helix-turn-helix YgiT family protein